MAGVLLYVCVCEVASEHTINRAPGGDADDASMTFGVYRTNAARKSSRVDSRNGVR